MPTFRNNTDLAISYESKGKLYSFPPHKDYPAKIWVPYQELGLELVNVDWPPVPESILLSGMFTFTDGMERKFNISHCNKYRLKVSVHAGHLKLYVGSSRIATELTREHDFILEWEKAPYIRLEGYPTESQVYIHAEVCE